MRYIAHRGNLEGPNPEKENHPDYVLEALKRGYDVEVDIWYEPFGGFYFGHDNPKYKITDNNWRDFNNYTDHLWLHAKSLDSLEACVFGAGMQDHHSFWHQNDDFTLTNKNYIWTYPGKQLTTRSIWVLPELSPAFTVGKDELRDFQGFGICSDYVKKIKEIREGKGKIPR